MMWNFNGISITRNINKVEISTNNVEISTELEINVISMEFQSFLNVMP